jgi:hypothetical protein
MNLRNISIDNNLNITNPNFTNSTLYIDTLCFDTNNCIDKSIFNNFNKINLNKEKYISDKYQYMYLPNNRAANGNIINNNNLIWNNIRNEISPDNNAEGKIKSINGTWHLDYNTNLWNAKNIYKIVYPRRTFNVQVPRYGLGIRFITTTETRTEILYYQHDGSGIEVRVPEHPNKENGEDYTVLWVQTLNERWSCFRVYEYDINNNVVVKYFHKHISGFNNLNKISPDGSTHNDVWNTFEWTPVPINLSGNTLRKLMISIFYEQSPSTIDSWFSGIAFSTNPWNHYKCSALELHWQIHKIDQATNNIIKDISNNYSYIKWWTNSNGDAWNNTRLAYFDGTAPSFGPVIVQFRIPFVYSGKDKIFYIIEHNTNLVPSVNEIRIFYNDTYRSLGNLSTAFKNPFATHYNSKIYQRYYAVRIPLYLLPKPDNRQNNNFINLRLPLFNKQQIFFTEIGTHDVSPF